ncbi:MAG: hypothetical protein WA003_12770 [Desulfuromonadaceae bacterium]
MNRKMIAGIAMAVGMLSAGVLSASAAESCGTCADKQAVQQFTRETAGLTRALNAKEIELREQYSYDGIDINRVSAIEAELKELKDKINTEAQKHGIPACSRG